MNIVIKVKHFHFTISHNPELFLNSNKYFFQFFAFKQKKKHEKLFQFLKKKKEKKISDGYG